MKRKTIAILLNLFLPPYGFYYLKDRKFFGWFFLVAMLSGLFGALWTYSAFVNGSGRTALITLIVYLLFLWGILIYATLRSESKEKNETDRDGSNRIFPSAYWFLPISFLFLLVSTVLIDALYKDRVLRAKIQLSSGMMPSLNVNDSFYMTELFETKELKRGDIVAYKDKNSDHSFLGRIVGLPGDKLELWEEVSPEGFKVLRTSVNGETFPLEVSQVRAEEWKTGLNPKNLIVLTEHIGEHSVPIFENRSQPTFVSVPKLTLGEREFYLLGDNRDDSLDSRTIGPIEADQIVGMFLFTYLSANLNDLTERVCETNQDVFCSVKRFYKIIILGNVRWDHLGYDNRNR
ncbi:signal peptidase I [Leptospira kmetyi]|uniref:Signal peptidase I n=1 Tax=Leptospira kmetyi TaxID=408139 RepID=A0ABX4NGL6_9LEPT|nr:signal peptidase I [Leptospira kmetyi]PJZ31658.1 signal peptidase I [Leptospira kmetyi]